MKLYPGVYGAEPGTLLQFILRNWWSSTTLYEPTEEAIRDLCIEHGLPVEHVFEVIESRSPNTHTILIDEETFMKTYQE